MTEAKQEELMAEAERIRILGERRIGARLRVIDAACRWYGFHAAAGTQFAEDADRRLLGAVNELLQFDMRPSEADVVTDDAGRLDDGFGDPIGET